MKQRAVQENRSDFRAYRKVGNGVSHGEEDLARVISSSMCNVGKDRKRRASGHAMTQQRVFNAYNRRYHGCKHLTKKVPCSDEKTCVEKGAVIRRKDMSHVYMT
jgi:hypothetical protein